MAANIVARNYAQTLLALADRHGGRPTVEAFARSLDEVVEAIRADRRIRAFLESPRVETEAKRQVLRAAFGGRVPDLFLRFLLVVVEKRREALLPRIAEAYHEEVDRALGQVRAEVVFAEEPDEALRREVVDALERRTGKTVLPRYTVDPALLGGVVIRVGDHVLDGSVLRRLRGMRRRLLEADLDVVPA